VTHAALHELSSARHAHELCRQSMSYACNAASKYSRMQPRQEACFHRQQHAGRACCYRGSSLSKPVALGSAFEPAKLARAICRANCLIAPCFSTTGALYAPIVNMDVIVPGHRTDLRVAASLLLARANDTAALGLGHATKYCNGVMNDLANRGSDHHNSKRSPKCWDWLYLQWDF